MKGRFEVQDFGRGTTAFCPQIFHNMQMLKKNEVKGSNFTLQRRKANGKELKLTIILKLQLNIIVAVVAVAKDSVAENSASVPITKPTITE